jgi:hypothetical protein
MNKNEHGHNVGNCRFLVRGRVRHVARTDLVAAIVEALASPGCLSEAATIVSEATASEGCGKMIDLIRMMKNE